LAFDLLSCSRRTQAQVPWHSSAAIKPTRSLGIRTACASQRLEPVGAGVGRWQAAATGAVLLRRACASTENRLVRTGQRSWFSTIWKQRRALA